MPITVRRLGAVVTIDVGMPARRPVGIADAAKRWKEGDHPRGQPENAGQFARTAEGAVAGRQHHMNRALHHRVIGGEEHENAALLHEAAARNYYIATNKYDLHHPVLGNRHHKWAREAGELAEKRSERLGLPDRVNDRVEHAEALQKALNHIDLSLKHREIGTAKHVEAAELHHEASGVYRAAAERFKAGQTVLGLEQLVEANGIAKRAEALTAQIGLEPLAKIGVRTDRVPAHAREGKTESELPLLDQAFGHHEADSPIWDLISGTAPINVRMIDSGLSHYQGKQISMTPEPTSGLLASVMRHEYGHAIDYNGEDTAASDALIDDVDEDANDIHDALKKLGFDPVEGFTTNRLNHIADAGAIDPEERIMFHDFLGAITWNQIGYGHSLEYYQRPGARAHEVFANYVALTTASGGDPTRTRAFLHSLAPRACKGFDEILSRRAAAGTLKRREAVK